MPGFKEQAESHYGLTHLMALSWSQCSLIIPKPLRPLRTMLNLLHLCSINGATKPEWWHICLQYSLLNTVSPLLTSAQHTGFLSNHYCSRTVHLATQEVWWRWATCLTLTHPVTQTHSKAHGSRGNLTSKSYYLRNNKAARDSDSSDRPQQSKLETFCQGFTILNATKNVQESWEEVKIATSITVLLEWWLGGVPDFSGGRSCRTARKAEVEPEDSTKLCKLW